MSIFCSLNFLSFYVCSILFIEQKIKKYIKFYSLLDLLLNLVVFFPENLKNKLGILGAEALPTGGINNYKTVHIYQFNAKSL